MAIHISEVSPVLDRISKQQQEISERLLKLIAIFKRAPEPVEPTLRSMLAPLRDGLDDMAETLHTNSNRPT